MIQSILTDKERYYPEVKKRITITIDGEYLKLASAGTNTSKFFNSLLREYVLAKNEDKFYDSFTSKVLKDEAFLNRLKWRLQDSSGNVVSRDQAIELVETNDWGA
jgi:hypothetical protein